MLTINTKTTKKGLVEFLREVAPMLKGKKKFKALTDSVNYTLKKFGEDANQVLREDLFLLAQDIQTVLGTSIANPATENSLRVAPKQGASETPAKKPTLKKGRNKEESTEEIAKGVMNIINGGKNKDKKDSNEVKDKKDKSGVTPKNLPEKAMPLAEQFPVELKVEGVGKLKVNMQIKSMKELFEAVNAVKELYFAMYWSQRHLKQFIYDTYNVNSKKFKEFPNDLDIAQLVYVSEEHKVAYAVSAYSEVCYPILPADLEISEGMRYANGVEFNIYETVE